MLKKKKAEWEKIQKGEIYDKKYGTFLYENSLKNCFSPL